VKEEIASQLAGRLAEQQRSIKRWRAACRTILFVLLAFSGLQYYFFDVYLTISALPSVTLLAALP
jgi:hypothetical protein